MDGDWSPAVHFRVDSGRMLVTDPCYGADAAAGGCAVEVQCAGGAWLAQYDRCESIMGGLRPRRLRALHHSVGRESGLFWELADGEAGVDSGQIGVFDAGRYPGKDEAFYRKACDITLSQYEAYRAEHGVGGRERPINVDDLGAVSSTCYGDGGYPVYLARDASGLVVGVLVDTQPDDEDDDDDEEDWDD